MEKANIQKFEDLLLSVNREGMDRLIEFIRKSDFYTAPASTKFHGSYEGGLLQHSLNVCECLLNKLHNPIWSEELGKVGRESLLIMSLLHDLCKTYYYVPEPKNKKIYSDSGKKADALGKYDWETVMGYTVDDKIPLGHGSKSVIMVSEYIKLKPVERFGILWHMGAYVGQQDWNSVGAAMEKYPAVLALHEADMEASYLMEKEEQ